MNERQQLLHRIGVCEFAMVDTALFLDTNPEDERALSYYDHHRMLRERLVGEYECKYGPLSIYGNKDPNYWRWINDPWPWDTEA